MTMRRIGFWLIAVLAVVVVAAGAVSAHGYASPVTDSSSINGAVESGATWMGPHMADHMGSGNTGWTAHRMGSYACPGSWNSAPAAGPTGGMMGGPNYWGMAGSGTGSFGFLWPLLLITLVLGIGYILVIRHKETGSNRALDLLRERYAKGELSEEEFVSRRETLQT